MFHTLHPGMKLLNNFHGWVHIFIPMKMQQKRQKCYNGWTHFQSGINWMQCMFKKKKRHYLKDKECAIIIDAPISSHNHRFMFTVFNANNISAISWRSILLKETRVQHGKNNSWQSLSHNVASSTPRHEWHSNSQC